MHDIDIANAKSRYDQEVQDELDEIVHRHYEMFKRHYPHCQLKKLDRGPATGGFQNYNWAIYTQDREEFARLPTIEFYRPPWPAFAAIMWRRCAPAGQRHTSPQASRNARL
jgi:hypothetical protein